MSLSNLHTQSLTIHNFPPCNMPDQMTGKATDSKSQQFDGEIRSQIFKLLDCLVKKRRGHSSFVQHVLN